jgi:hypothetical protein
MAALQPVEQQGRNFPVLPRKKGIPFERPGWLWHRSSQLGRMIAGCGRAPAGGVDHRDILGLAEKGLSETLTL